MSSSLRPFKHNDRFWRFTLYPDAAEGGGSFSKDRRHWALAGVPKESGAEDPDRAAFEAARRAKTALRRYCTANRLDRLGTLTYATPCQEPEQIRADLREFFKSLRTARGGKAFPYAWVPEWHKTGDKLHAHFAVGDYLPRKVIEQAWGRGFVHIKRLGNAPVGLTDVASSRRAAGYLSKYVAKSFEDVRRIGGLHRYDVAQGFQPKAVHFTGQNSGQVLADASELMSTAPTTVWSSSQSEDWQGPPTIWAQWGN